MKKYFNILIATAVAALAVVSCQKKEEPYQAGTKDDPGCYGVYFPTQEASGAHTYDPEMATEVEITVARTNTSGAIKVPFTTTVSEDGIFNFGDIEFADGQSETVLKVTFPTVTQGVNYKMSITLDDNASYVSKYNSGAISFDFSVLQVKWEDFLNPETKEPAVITLYEGWWDEVHLAKLSYYEVNDVRTCVLSSIEEGNGIWGDSYGATLQFTWYLKENNEAGNNFLEVPKQYFGFDYDDWTSKDPGSATSPIYVYDYYHYWIERGNTPEDLGGEWLDFAKKRGQSDGSGGYPVGYYDGNGGFIFNLRYYIPGLGGFSPDPYEFQAIVDGFTRVDYSLEIEADYTVEGVTPIYTETGVDVAYLKYAVYEGELNSAQLAAKVDAIVAGTEEAETYSDFEYDEEEGKNYGAFGIAPDETGYYTVVVIPFDETDTAQTEFSTYVVVKHIAAEDTEEFSVDLSVFTEAVPARYGDTFTEYDSFAFGIIGTDIEEAHLYITPTSKATDAVFEAVKYSEDLAVDDDVIEQINQLGGYYDVVGGLDPGTSYTVIVWATNGDMDITITDTWETTPSPEVWKSIGTGIYTEDFFTTFFKVDPVTMDVEIEQSEDDPTRYRMIYPYDEKYIYNDPGDWDTSKSYDIVFTIPDADHVYITPQEIGVDWGYGMFSIASAAGRYIASGYDIEIIEKNGIPFGQLKDGVVTFPEENSLLISMAGYNAGAFYYANTNGAFKITLPEAVEKDSASTVPASIARPAQMVSSRLQAAPSVKAVKYERDPQPVKVTVVKMDNVRKEKANARTISETAQNFR